MRLRTLLLSTAALLAAAAMVPAAADQQVLLDTTKESMLDWTRYPYGPQSPTPGWVEESFTNFEKGINWRSYVVCDVGYPNVNNWLWTPFITRHDANRIYIEVKFSLRNCDLFPGTALQCKETFSLLYYEFDVATREPPPWEPESYKQIDVIAADEGRFTNNNEVIINTEVRSIEVTKKGVYFAFRDQGACLSLLAVKVYYLKCPEITVGFAHYPETATGRRLTDVEKINGQCVANSVAVRPPHNLCKADGTWSWNSGLCSCMAGYEASDSAPSSSSTAVAVSGDMSCRQCPVGKFKHEAGDGPCLICPPHSQALFTGSVECRCSPNFYRSPDEAKSAACTRPPSAPQNLHYRFLPDQPGTARLTWEPPLDEGARSDTRYSVACDGRCQGVKYSPADATKLAQTSVTVSGLQASATYAFRVTAHNGVSGQTTLNESTGVITVPAAAGASPSLVSDVRVVGADDTQVTLEWRAPSLDIDVYEVRYYVDGAAANTSKTLVTKHETAEIRDLRENTRYALQVRAQTARGDWGDFSQPVYGRTGAVLDPVFVGGRDAQDDGQLRVLVGVLTALLLLACVVAFLVYFFKRGALEKRAEKDCDSLDYRGIENNFMVGGGGAAGAESLPIVPGGLPGGAFNLPGGGTLYNPFSSHKTYVDPHTYEDPNAAVKQFAKEIDSKHITIEAIIGGGEFGDVCRGRLTLLPGDRQDMLVAIKTLKPGSSDKAKVDFLSEASIMGQFEHPNVIFLQGVVTKANPIMIITEYMENGSLDTFLRANDGKFQVMQLVGMMRGIAYGMQYLAEMNYVHRDLAARNVLVNSQLVCKIADFGLSREIPPETGGGAAGPGGAADGAYTTRGGKIPVRWTAPEAIAFRKFTSSSDVWSFGIVMWEVMSFGERPYWTWSNQDVIKAIEKGYRLPAPMDCPEAIHQLMLDAWQKERSHRPGFASIVKTLDKLICCPETLKKIAASPVHNAYAMAAASSSTMGGGGPELLDFSELHSIPDWLASIKMSRYNDSFARFDSLDDVAKLSLQQLVDLGVTLVGHQKKIMSSIQAMRAHKAVTVSEGFLV